MKVYITCRFKGSSENKLEIERLCAAVRNAGMQDFHFIRDVEDYKPNAFSSLQELWESARHHISICDALLIDISDNPSGGRLIEAGIAYALKKPIYVIVKNGVEYKGLYDGISAKVIGYDDISDITQQLKFVQR